MTTNRFSGNLKTSGKYHHTHVQRISIKTAKLDARKIQNMPSYGRKKINFIKL